MSPIYLIPAFLFGVFIGFVIGMFYIIKMTNGKNKK